jgi:hypothetical protein
MQKKYLLGTSCLLLMFVMVLFAGCAHTYHFNKETPPEQQATLKIVGPYQRIVALDEVGVKWKSAAFMASIIHNTVKLPAGPHTLTVNYKEGSGLMAATSRADAMHVGENFLPGHTYMLTAQRIGNAVNLSLMEASGTQGGK